MEKDPKDISQSIENKFILEDTAKEKIKKYILEACKKTILEELDALCSINQATLFPDLENTAKYVKTIR
ncbi:hypothetical protein WN875_10490 [Tetragenococcus halophilus]|uniref:hypothetical protein n=1 Tax=Tetragenococcus halophilus TaxID=51669 RepID=UPI0030F156C0